MTPESSRPQPGRATRKDLWTLSLTALGVVFGDIGTSPLYAFRECFDGVHGVTPDRANVLGVLSLITWSLLVIISVKYLAYVMRADNDGEGGILALMALARAPHKRGASDRVVVILGLFGAALLFGDGIITPAISVLSAVEGVEVATPALAPYVVPLTALILAALFCIQHRGTSGVGAVFGPVTLLWFLAIGVVGAAHIAESPGVLEAVHPLHAVRFFSHHGVHGFLVLGSVFLCVTGGEALYADMGHFGVKPIRRTWFVLVLPALLLNYYGQGASILVDPKAAENPFYSLAPGWSLYPMVILATAATIIASQALISGAFSITRQAIMLGFWPRTRILHTSVKHMGQIYAPFINWTLMALTLAVVVAFKRSSNLAAAYGIAVTTTMVITTLLAFVVARRRWRWPLPVALVVTLGLLAIDLSFFGANLVKVADGGWLPLVVALGIYAVMSTWRRGRELLGARMSERVMPWSELDTLLAREEPATVRGAAVYLTGSREVVPPALVHNLIHNHVLHERVIVVTAMTEGVPYVPREERIEREPGSDRVVRLTLRYGFMEEVDIPVALQDALGPQAVDPARVSFFLGRETILATSRPGMALWRERLFAFMVRNAQRATAFFRIPPDRVVEMGSEVEL